VGRSSGGTKSLAITCHDPDAPTTVGFTHWVLFNLPRSSGASRPGAGAAGKAPKGATLGFTDYGESAYGGMAPPPGDPPHRYQFTVYALDVPRLEGGDERTTYAKFRFLIRGHVLAQGTLTGLFGRKA
jgi:Raf kinase inhibitor-like YbhB/YbcL family protein